MQEKNVALPNYKIPPHLRKYFRPKLCNCYVCNITKIFREAKRVLRSDGTLWLNLGDSYAGSNQGAGTISPTPKQASNRGTGYMLTESHINNLAKVDGLRPKNLVGIPWRVAFALQADGWYLRQDIILSKRNPMPESVKDRCCKSHEYLFLLTKSARYFYDAEAIKENSVDAESYEGRRPRNQGEMNKIDPDNYKFHGSVENGKLRHRQTYPKRNKRSVWEYSTQPFGGAHFATFSEPMILPAILAGTAEKGCCSSCGAAWVREIERTGHINKREVAHMPNNTPTKTDSTGWKPLTQATNNWQPSCKCYGTESLPTYPNPGEFILDDPYQDLFRIQRIEPIRFRRQTLLDSWRSLPTTPCVVLDPFGGAMTTAVVASKHGRKFIMIELSESYIKEIGIPRIEKATGQLRLF